MKQNGLVRRICLGVTASIGFSFFISAGSIAWAAGTVSGNEFNPSISLILDGKLTAYSNDPDAYAVSGFVLGDEAGLAPEGLSLGESELDISANIDDKFYGFFNVAILIEDGETEVEIEEAYLQTLALPKGLTIKAGRFFSDVGYLNTKHAHAWDFVDQPLAYRALLDNQFADVGIQSRWLAPTPIFLEFITEVFRGDSYPAGGAANDGVGGFSLMAQAGGDVGTSQSWQAGVSYLSLEAANRTTQLDESTTLAFTGDSNVVMLDVVWKWAPDGNARQRNAIVQAEYLNRDEDGDIAVFANGVDSTARYDGNQDGFYIQGIYQFIPRWRAGLRFDRLTADNDITGLLPATPLAGDNRDPSRVSAMIDFSNSEFSRFRLQLAEDRSGPDNDTQIYFQYLMSLGAHGAHSF